MYKAVKGMNDVLPGAGEAFLESALWEHIEHVAARVLGQYGYRRAQVPIVEETQLFARGLGDATDIVSKEMYTFSDRGDRSLTLRPECTAGVVRAYVEHGYGHKAPVQRWWYMGPMFRAERPQKGRYRQFYQIGAEFFGVATPASDAETMIMLHRLCTELELGDVTIKINSLGDPESRVAYRAALLDYLRPKAKQLCESCQSRMETNPLRTLDCKRPECKSVMTLAPDVADSLSLAAITHFKEVEALLAGAGVPCVREPRLVRGLDYYTGVIFEFSTSALGAQDAILGGGRYDSLVEELGGPSTPAVGFAVGVERLALLLSARTKISSRPDLYLIPFPEVVAECMALAEDLRRTHGLRVEVDLAGGKLKTQMKRADQSGALHVMVLGADEIASNTGKIKDMRSGESLPVVLISDEIVCMITKA